MTEDRLNTLDIPGLRAQQAHFQQYVSPWREKIKKIVDYYNSVDTECRAIIKNSTEALPDAIRNDFLIAVGLPFDKSLTTARELRKAIQDAEIELADLLQNKAVVEDLTKSARVFRDRCERLSYRINELEASAKSYQDAMTVCQTVDVKKDLFAERIVNERRDMFNARYADVQWLLDIDIRPALQKAIDARIVKEIQ